MTQTLRTSEGRYKVWIEADHGRGKRGKARLVEISKILLKDWLEYQNFQDLNEDQEGFIKAEILKFKNGIAWEANDTESYLFSSYAEARSWAMDQDC